MNMLLMTPFKDPGIMESLNAFSNMKKELKLKDLFDGSNPSKLEEVAYLPFSIASTILD